MKISDILKPVSTKYGAPMGRPNVLTAVKEFKNQKTGETFTTISGGRIVCKRVHLDSGGYDIGGAYWGIGYPIYVHFTKDLSFVEFYRAE